MAYNPPPPPPLERQNSFPPQPPTPDIREQNRFTRDVFETDSEEEYAFSDVEDPTEENAPNAITEEKPDEAKNANLKKACPNGNGAKQPI